MNDEKIAEIRRWEQKQKRIRDAGPELLAILREAVECRDAIKWQTEGRRLIEWLDADIRNEPKAMIR